jgi:arthrofactin-type cyclic lipopeptide synthetase A
MLPLTANGKLDRKALPGYEAPQGEIETKLARICAEVLKVERVGRQDNFFSLGGHSLLAVLLVDRMRRVGFRFDVSTIFAAPTVAALAAITGSAGAAIEVPVNGIPGRCERITPEMLPLVKLEQLEIDGIVKATRGGAANVQDIYPLTPLQEGILFHHLMGGERDPYVVCMQMAFDTRAGLAGGDTAA